MSTQRPERFINEKADLFDADELMASPTEPLSAEKRQHQLVRMFAALDNLVRAESPTKEDWRLCSDAVNMVESLIDMGICEDNSGLLMDAITALAKAGKRNLEGKPIRLDGQGLTAVRGFAGLCRSA